MEAHSNAELWSVGILSALEALGFTVARTQDAKDGESVRLLREALPEHSFRFGLASAGRVRCYVTAYLHGDVVCDSFGTTLAEAADACRAAIEARA